MKIKSKASDFVVVERLEDGYVRERGAHRVYRVTKRKLTSLEAARALADEAGVAAADVGLAGLKDRQGVTTQFMSVHHGRPVFVKLPDLRIETAGFAADALTSRHSLGNAFEITVRGLERGDRESIERQISDVREHGVPNYFGEQRFGNVKHGQGWIARELALGHHEKALRMLLAAPSESDDPRTGRFKSSLSSRWGDWRACRELAGRFGQHISVFEHLTKQDGDFAGAFRYVASRVRLIHLYAWQSHVWNRALARLVDHAVPRERRFAIPSTEGPLVFHARGPIELDPAMRGVLRLPGEGLDDVEHPLQRDLLALALRDEGLQPGDFRIQGVPGFQLKGEDRAILVHPRELVIEPRAPSPDSLVVRFELPRGSYATLVLARLVPRRVHVPRESGPREGAPRDRGPRDSGPRDHGPRDHGPRDRGPRDRGPRDSEPRDSGPRDTRSRERRPRDDAPRAPHAAGAEGRDRGPRVRAFREHTAREPGTREPFAGGPQAKDATGRGGRQHGPRRSGSQAYGRPERAPVGHTPRHGGHRGAPPDAAPAPPAPPDRAASDATSDVAVPPRKPRVRRPRADGGERNRKAKNRGPMHARTTRSSKPPKPKGKGNA